MIDRGPWSVATGHELSDAHQHKPACDQQIATQHDHLGDGPGRTLRLTYILPYGYIAIWQLNTEKRSG
jgi:hypothetical protein